MEPPSCRPLLEDFIGFRLRRRGLGARLSLPAPPIARPVHLAMRAAGDEFDRRFSRAFSPLSSQLHVTPGLARQRLAQVAEELFGGGGGETNWGRLVAFFAFGAALCEECVDKEMPHLVDQLVGWMADYLERHLQEWIQRNGGWAQFVVLYGDGGGSDTRKVREGYWTSVKTVVTGAVAIGAFLTLGAFFANK